MLWLAEEEADDIRLQAIREATEIRTQATNGNLPNATISDSAWVGGLNNSNAGSVTFVPAPGGRGTEVKVAGLAQFRDHPAMEAAETRATAKSIGTFPAIDDDPAFDLGTSGDRSRHVRLQRGA